MEKQELSAAIFTFLHRSSFIFLEIAMHFLPLYIFKSLHINLYLGGLHHDNAETLLCTFQMIATSKWLCRVVNFKKINLSVLNFQAVSKKRHNQRSFG